MKICTWNINGMSNKLAKPFVYNPLLDHDLCVLTEIHSKTIKNVPGFKMIVSKSVKREEVAWPCSLKGRSKMISLT